MAAQSPPSRGDASELIVVFKAETAISAERHGIMSRSVNTSPIQSVLDKYNASCRSLFGLSSERLQRQQAGIVSIATAEPVDQPRIEVPDLSRFHRVYAPEERLEQLAKKLLANDHVEAAYVKPPVTAPLAFTARISSAVPAPALTPNFIDRQGYLDNGWRFTHEDLLANQGGITAGTSSSKQDDIDHGTAVLGVISGDDNNFGVTGITPDAVISASSWSSVSSAAAIKAAADKLRPGDVILLEGHRPGPNSPNPPPFVGSQLGFIAIEWWPDDFAAVQYAVAKGIVVVAAAGNGFEDLDSSIYNTPMPGFPTSWRNPFNPRNTSSGAIIVGAGQCPPGTHGRATLPDRSRCDFSNWGSRVDVQGWGVEVTTTGYGYLQSGLSQDVWYTDTFNGTSSASPIVTGALISVQGVLKARGRRVLTSPEARTLLRSCGSAQQDEPSRPARQRIGNRPDLRALIPAA
ncbi:peptidase S8/S53 domain-containing protein, partial [Pyrenochaeta sp. MPI-SDFR-AT-0127]